MGTIWVEGRFRTAAQPVKIKSGSSIDSGDIQETLKNYVTKEQLEVPISELEGRLDGLDHSVVEETLTIG